MRKIGGINLREIIFIDIMKKEGQKNSKGKTECKKNNPKNGGQ